MKKLIDHVFEKENIIRRIKHLNNNKKKKRNLQLVLIILELFQLNQRNKRLLQIVLVINLTVQPILFEK